MKKATIMGKEVYLEPERKFKVNLEFELALKHDDDGHDQRVKDELVSAISHLIMKEDLAYEVDDQEYHVQIDNISFKHSTHFEVLPAKNIN
jgi:hypothetical protein